MRCSCRYYLFAYTLLICIVFLPRGCLGQESSPEKVRRRIYLKGFIKDLQLASFNDDPNSLITGNYLHNRINFRWEINNNLNLRIESRNRLYYGEQVKSTYNFGKYIGNDPGYFDLSYNVVNDTNLVLNTTVDRALLMWTKNKLEVTIGRQRVNWGVNLVWNPNDIFNTFNYFDFDYEERPGSDAIRVQYSSGTFSSVQAVYKPSREANRQVGAIMYKTNLRKYDLQSFLGVYQQDLVAGTGWAGNVKQTGFKGEISYFYPYAETADTNRILTGSVSFDRTFKGNYMGVISYLYNSNGKEVSYRAADFSRINLSAKNLMPFIHTVFVQVTKAFNPLVTGSFAIMYSPTKNTVILFPTCSISLAENWDLAFIGQLFFADMDSVYRTLGNAVYLRLRWSF